MELKTGRLRIIPLTIEQLEWFITDKSRLEKSLGVNPVSEQPDEETLLAMTELFKKAKTEPELYLWNTNWQIVLISRNIVVGSACFIYDGDNPSVVEIGYGIDMLHRSKGYMTEAVKSMCDWALSRPGIEKVIASTERDNNASMRVLEKCGMKKVSDTQDGLICWELEK